MSTATLEAPTGLIEHQPAPVLEPRPSLWGPEWDVCPWCDCGTPSDDRRPCSCGAQLFLIVRNDGAAEKCRHVCKRCYREPMRRLARPGDRIVGVYDAATGAFTPH